MIQNGLFVDLTVVIVVATVGALLARILRQPIIPAYLISGLIIGPAVLGIITDVQNIRFFAEIGIAFMLFLVGLELDLKRIKSIGVIASMGGLLQIFILFSLGILLALYLGFSALPSVYVAFMLVFSSTLVVVKILSDKREIDTLHGRIAIGILLVQDIVAVLALSVLSTFNNFAPELLLIALGKGLLLFIIAVVFSKFLFPSLFKFAAQTPELLFLLSLTTLFIFALLAQILGFSIAIGGFIAGFTLANLEYNLEIIARVKSLRDFFSTLFFVSLGMEFLFIDINKLWIVLLSILGFVLIVKPVVTYLICIIFGYSNRTSLSTSMGLAQISEFSFIILLQGLFLGHITEELFSIAILMAIVTIALSTYLLQYDQWIISKIGKSTRWMEFLGRKTKTLEFIPEKYDYDTLLIGADRIGHNLIETLDKLKHKLLVIDFNPEIINLLVRENIPCLYGDVGDLEIIERIKFNKLKLVISTQPIFEVTLLMLKKVRRKNKSTKIIVTANNIDNALKLYDAGADYVILPHFLGGARVSLLLEEIHGNRYHLRKEKKRHFKELIDRKTRGHEHPKQHEKH